MISAFEARNIELENHKKLIAERLEDSFSHLKEWWETAEIKIEEEIKASISNVDTGASQFHTKIVFSEGLSIEKFDLIKHKLEPLGYNVNYVYSDFVNSIFKKDTVKIDWYGSIKPTTMKD